MWHITLDPQSSTSEHLLLRFRVDRDGATALLGEGVASKDEAASLVYDFARRVVEAGDSFWRPLLDTAALEVPSCGNLESRFLSALRVSLDGARPSQASHDRLLFEISAAEGRWANTEERIWTALRCVTEIYETPRKDTMSYEQKVLRIATVDGGRLKGAASKRVVARLVEWLENRGAVNEIRRLFPSFFWLLRSDTIRLLIVVVLTLGAMLRLEDKTQVFMRGTYSIGWCALIVFYFGWVVVFPVLAREGSRYRLALRPGFRLRWQGMSRTLIVTILGGFIAQFAASAPGSVIVIVLLIGLVAAALFWRQFCRASLNGARFQDTENRIARRRTVALLAMHIEESLAIAGVFGLLRPLIFVRLDSARDKLTHYGRIHLGFLDFPRIITLDVFGHQWNLQPAFIVLLLGLTLIFAILFELKRFRGKR